MSENHSRSGEDAADAESLQSYEQLLYPDLFFSDTHPDIIATVAALYGMSPASPGSDAGCWSWVRPAGET